MVENSGVLVPIQQFIEAAPSPTLLVTEDGGIAMMNSQAEQVFQYAREELVGQSVEVLIPARFRQGHVHDRGRYCAAPETRAMGTGRELWALRKDGHEFPVEVGLNSLKTDHGIFIVTSIVDITDRKHAEHLFHQLFEHSPDGTVVAEQTGRIALVNSRAEEMFGYTSDELIGKRPPVPSTPSTTPKFSSCRPIETFPPISRFVVVESPSASAFAGRLRAAAKSSSWPMMTIITRGVIPTCHRMVTSVSQC